jgi:cytochrome P450
METPAHPIAAVTQFNPYPYYAQLAAERPRYYDAELGLWIASSAEAVAAVLTNELCRVRPTAEPIPKALLGSPAADIFGRLVRMNDGEHHRSLKGAVSSSLTFINTDHLTHLSQQWAEVLAGEMLPHRLSDFTFQLSVYVIGSLLGIPRELLPQTAHWLNDFVRCLAPGSNLEQIEKGKVAAGELLELMRSVLQDSREGLLMRFAQPAKRNGHDETSIIANGIGFLSQAYEATAGLIGNTLVTLARNSELHKKLSGKPTLLHAILLEVLRYDSPIQNTRRFVIEDGIIAGQEMKTGDAILVVLAAANYDSSVNPNPQQFDPFRQDRRSFTFGLGIHACPGETLALAIARGGLEQLLNKDISLQQLTQTVTYRHSTNTRIPLFMYLSSEST